MSTACSLPSLRSLVLPSASADVLVTDAELERLAHEVRVADHHAHGRRADALDAAGHARAGVVAHLDLQRAVAALGVDARVEVLGELDALAGARSWSGRPGWAAGGRRRRSRPPGPARRSAGTSCSGRGSRDSEPPAFAPLASALADSFSVVWIDRFCHGQPLASSVVGVRSTLSSPLACTDTPLPPVRHALRRVALVVGARDRDRARERQDEERVVGRATGRRGRCRRRRAGAARRRRSQSCCR